MHLQYIGYLDMASFLFPDMAQRLLQMQGMRNDAKHEKLQRVQQRTILQCVSVIISDLRI